MKKYTRIISFILVFVLIFSAGVISSSAALPPVEMGDVTLDKKVDATDATYIQRYLVEIETMSEYQAFAGDVDLDHSVTIVDATHIQRLLAQLIEELPSGDYVDSTVYADVLYSDYSSGKAMVDTPVTFTAAAFVDNEKTEPLMYEFRINDVVVQEYSESNVLVYTFKEPGEYDVEFTVKSRLGYTDDCWRTLTVIEKTEITDLYISSISLTGLRRLGPFEAIARNGVEPYKYEFVLYEGDEILEGKIVQEQLFSTSNKFKAGFEFNKIYTLLVTAKDASGDTCSESITFGYETPPPM